MPFPLFLHRSFDTQLSPVAASIIDWAPMRRGGQSDSDLSQDVQLSAERQSAMQDGVRHAVRREREQIGEARRRVSIPSIESQGVADGFTGRLSQSIRKSGAVTASKSSPVRLEQCQLMVNSYAAMPLFTRGTLSLNAGLFAAVGLTGGPSSSSLFPVSSARRPFFHTSDVLQLECIWGRMYWTGVLNVVCFSWRSKMFPLFEFIGITPSVDWSVQADGLLFNWNGFWRVFVRGDRRRRRDSLISMKTPADPAPRHRDVAGSSSSSMMEAIKQPDVVATLAKTNSPTRESAVVPAPMTVDGSKGIRGEEHHPRVSATEHYESVQEGAASVKGATLAAGDSPKPQKHIGKHNDVADEHYANEALAHPTSSGEKYRWWQLEELRCGAGFAVKNDLASGVNVYCGCSAHMGRQLTVSTHVDALRRTCCSITSTTASLDLATRLRMNLITWHRTELDAGIGWRPLKHAPGITCRLSHSMGRTFVGVTVADVVAQCGKVLRWGKDGPQHPGDGNAKRTRGQHAAGATVNSPETGLSSSSSSSSSVCWYDPYLGWLTHVGGLLSAMASATATPAAAPVKRTAAHALSMRERLSQATRRGFECAKALSCEMEFDLTLGVGTERPHAKGLRLFVSLSAH
ncbi:hypothetical protein DQ04_06881020 [Trypanosoma grayi]|uniref:hypothetical protein n=1 Tax=Trypanosoma grayi TaxID=71804 RepID=UPI0004F42F67|nr:hypothetical protein DQ04_06881020 [Trypanosoma grayi]KEG08576.1 hypothetical protein DQ04_06881020 [Trypanosoma grayi]